MLEGENKGDKEGTGEGISESEAEDGRGTKGEEQTARLRLRTCGERSNKARGEEKKTREQVELVRVPSQGTANYHILTEQSSKQRGQPKAGAEKAEVGEERRRRRSCVLGFFFFFFLSPNRKLIEQKHTQTENCDKSAE